MTKVVSAYEARTNFGELLNLVYYQGEDIIVTKSGKRMVRITKEQDTVTNQKRADKLWKEIRAIAKKGRQDVDLVEFIRKDRDSGHKLHP